VARVKVDHLFSLAIELLAGTLHHTGLERDFFPLHSRLPSQKHARPANLQSVCSGLVWLGFQVQVEATTSESRFLRSLSQSSQSGGRCRRRAGQSHTTLECQAHHDDPCPHYHRLMEIGHPRPIRLYLAELDCRAWPLIPSCHRPCPAYRLHHLDYQSQRTRSL
jgi:hypothetical protein